MKNILVTGAAGFIGFHLCLYLKKKESFVIGVDNFNPYYLPSLKDERAKNLAEHGIEVVKADVQSQETLEKLVLENKITHVVHLAAQAGVRHSFSHPQDYISSNINGFVALLEVLKKHPQIKLIFASSSSVYGLNTSIPFREDHTTDLPTNLYGATKKAGEMLAFSYHHLYKIPMVGLRYFTVYGPWGRPDMAYFRFTESIIEEKPLPVFNHGNMMRDFTYIDDIVQGTANALDLDSDFNIFNLGNSKPSSVIEMIEILEELLGRKAEKTMLSFQPGEMEKTYADISKSKEQLNYDPKTSLKEGLKNFVTWYSEQFRPLIKTF